MKILNTKKYLAYWEKNAKVINRQSVEGIVYFYLSQFGALEMRRCKVVKSWHVDPNKQLFKFILMVSPDGKVHFNQKVYAKEKSSTLMQISCWPISLFYFK